MRLVEIGAVFAQQEAWLTSGLAAVWTHFGKHIVGFEVGRKSLIEYARKYI